MKPTRILATASLIISSVALITAANLSVGDEPGVVRMSSFSPQDGTALTPVPDPMGAGTATLAQPPVQPSPYPQPGPYAPYFERSMSATGSLPNGAFYAPEQPFGPIMMFESNFDQGLGFDKGYQRLNARVPYHIMPNQTVLMGDLSASVTNSGDPLGNAGLVYRNYDEMRNRVFGVNIFGDYDEGYGNSEWYRMTAGFESLGKYIDWRANGYFVVGDDSTLISSTLDNNLALSGFNAFKLRNEVRENAYSGFDIETGGPLPFLGRYGMNMYAGLYMLGNDTGYDTTGFQARWEALITQNLTVNTYLTSDDTFGTNSWVSLQYSMPNYKNQRILKPRIVRERLQDPVVRSTRIHTNIDSVIAPEACINPLTGVAFNLFNVDPNATVAGIGTFENPFNTLQAAALANNAAVDLIRVRPRTDDTGTNLTVNGGMGLFDNQILLSSIKSFAFDPDCIIPGTPTATDLGPLISNPIMVAGGSVVRVGNNNQIIGMRIDASNTDNTIFGNGVLNPLPITDINLTMNTFTDYTTGANLQDVSGRADIIMNTFSGLAGTSTHGLNLTAAGGSTMDLLVTGNTATNNSVAGLSIVAESGATINAFDPNNATAPTGIVNNTTTNNGNGIVLSGGTGSTINAVVENNTSTGNTLNGFLGETDGGTYNLFSMRNNAFSANGANGAFLHYLNGGQFRSVSEDRTEDLNLNGVLDAGEDTDGDGLLDVANGTIDPGEDLNGNGLLDEGIVSNTMSGNAIVGLCIFGEGSGDGFFDIGGETPALGNLFVGNSRGGVAVDLTGTAEATINAMNNRVFAFGIPSPGDVLRTGFNQNTLAANDDLSTGLINTGFTMNFFGQIFNDLTVNNNGNVSFNGPLFTFTPFPLLTTATPMIAPFFADVDTRLGPIVSYGNGTVNGLQAFGVNYEDVRHFSVFGTNQGLPTNNFQLVLVDRSDVSPGDFDMEFNYDRILWEAGEASGSDAFGLGGSTARVGWTNGVNRAFELPGSAVAGAFLDSGPASTSLVQNSLNSGVLGRYIFESRNGNITSGAAVSNSDGISVRLSGDAVLNQGRFINNTISQSLGNGLTIAASDNATASNVVIQGNDITLSRSHGVSLTADGPGATITAVVGGLDNNVLRGQSFPQGNTITDNGSSGTGDGVHVLATNDGTVQGGIFGNDLLDNGGNGIGLNVENGGTVDFGTPASNRLISGNTITGNDGAGIRIVSNVSATTANVIDAVIRDNEISQNAAGGIVATLNGPNNTPPGVPAVIENNVLNLTVGGTTLADSNLIDGNGDVGIGVEVNGNGRANVDIHDATITNTTDGPDPILNGDGINLRRADSALLTAVIDNVTSTGNAGDGIDVETQGNDKNDPNQPMSGTPNTVTITDSNFSNNILNGARFRTRGDSVLIGDVSNSTFSNNGQNGILVQTSENSSFGDPTIGLPPGRRSVFDGLFVEGNGVDGIQIVATEDSRALVEITSTAIAASSSAHAAASTLGATSISNNGRDGVRITTTGGRSDILITSGTATTTIDGNGTAAGGNGIRWDASGSSEGIVRVTRTTISNSIAGLTEITTLNGNGVLDPGEDVNGNGVLDPGEDANANQDVDVAEGDGIQANLLNNATATLIVGNVGEGNVIQSNGDDGIAVTATGSNASGNPRPIITITDNTIGATVAGITAGNGGDGVSLNVLGGTNVGLAPATLPPPNVDFTLPGLSPNDGVTESGAVPQFTMSNNLVSDNERRGVNVQLTGASGTRDRENGNSFFDPVRITLDDNTIVSNGEEGIFYRADAEMNQSRFVYLDNFVVDNTNYSPFRPEFFALNVGSVNGNTAYAPPYLNLRTVQNSFLTLTNNTIQNNGTNTVTGEGIRIDVGTGAYVAADIQGNTFGGNLEEDVVTSSFLSFGNTFDSQDSTTINTTFDFVYLDDSAQLDMRFQNNSGNQIAPSDAGAVYTNNDLLKQQFFGFPGVIQREASFFQVDNGPSLNSPNNTFTNFAITQDIQAAFTNGGYNLRGAADPLFPNIGFAPFLP